MSILREEDDIDTGIFSFNTVLNAYVADMGTAGGKKAFVVAPFAGTVTYLTSVNYAANATTVTNFTLKKNGNAFTIPTWQVAITQAAGTALSVVPVNLTVLQGDVLEIDSDGGSSTVMPVNFSIGIQSKE